MAKTESDTCLGEPEQVDKVGLTQRVLLANKGRTVPLLWGYWTPHLQLPLVSPKQEGPAGWLLDLVRTSYKYKHLLKWTVNYVLTVILSAVDNFPDEAMFEELRIPSIPVPTCLSVSVLDSCTIGKREITQVMDFMLLQVGDNFKTIHFLIDSGEVIVSVTVLPQPHYWLEEGTILWDDDYKS